MITSGHCKKSMNPFMIKGTGSPILHLPEEKIPVHINSNFSSSANLGVF